MDISESAPREVWRSWALADPTPDRGRHTGALDHRHGSRLWQLASRLLVRLKHFPVYSEFPNQPSVKASLLLLRRLKVGERNRRRRRLGVALIDSEGAPRQRPASHPIRPMAHPRQGLADRPQRHVARPADGRRRVPDPRRERRPRLCVAGAARALDGQLRVRRLRLCLDLGAAARRRGRSRPRLLGAALHPGIFRAARSAACCAASSPAAAGSPSASRAASPLVAVGGIWLLRDRWIRSTWSCRSISPAWRCRSSRSATCRTASRARTTG